MHLIEFLKSTWMEGNAIFISFFYGLWSGNHLSSNFLLDRLLLIHFIAKNLLKKKQLLVK